MKFHGNRPIFQQIIEDLEEQIIRGRLAPEERIPAIRDYALAVEVNPNTVVRSFLALEEAGIIFKRRGLGFFVSPGARGKILARRRCDFVDSHLPETVRTMRLLDVGIDVLVDLYNRSAREETGAS